MDKERPGELHKKIKRLKSSRDELKDNNCEKALQKKLRDRNVELTASRDLWRSRSKELKLEHKNQNERLMQQLQEAKKETERERKRADEESKRADKLRSEMNVVFKKKSRP